jgi:hypothetical protein
MKELFRAKDMKMISPRLKWQREHRLKTEYSRKRPTDFAWKAYNDESFACGIGTTEEEALRDWGVKTANRLWNEVNEAAG